MFYSKLILQVQVCGWTAEAGLKTGLLEFWDVRNDNCQIFETGYGDLFRTDAATAVAGNEQQLTEDCVRLKYFQAGYYCVKS
jgi:hypothetical protein